MKFDATEKCMLWCPNVNVDDAIIYPEKHSSIQDIIDLVNRCGALLDESLYYFVGEDEIWNVIDRGEKIWVLQITPDIPETRYCILTDDKSIYNAMRMHMTASCCSVRRIGYFKLRKKYIDMIMLENLTRTWEQKERYLNICLDTSLRDADPLMRSAFGLPARYITVRELLDRVDVSRIAVYANTSKDIDQMCVVKMENTSVVLEYLSTHNVDTITIYNRTTYDPRCVKKPRYDELNVVMSRQGENVNDIVCNLIDNSNGTTRFSLLAVWKYYSADGVVQVIKPTTSNDAKCPNTARINDARDSFFSVQLMWETMDIAHDALKEIPNQNPTKIEDLLTHIISDGGLMYRCVIEKSTIDRMVAGVHYEGEAVVAGINRTTSFDTAVSAIMSTEYPVDKIFYVEFNEKRMLNSCYVRNFYMAATDETIADMINMLRCEHLEYGNPNILGCWK